MIRKIAGGFDTVWRKEVKLTCVRAKRCTGEGKLSECSDIRLTQNWDQGLSVGWLLGKRRNKIERNDAPEPLKFGEWIFPY